MLSPSEIPKGTGTGVVADWHDQAAIGHEARTQPSNKPWAIRPATHKKSKTYIDLFPSNRGDSYDKPGQKIHMFLWGSPLRYPKR
jgi:hypothetical protein